MSKLTKLSPSLKVVADDVAAQKLRELLKDADDGFRRVVKVGLYIEWIAANLEHGQFRPWLEAHAPEVPHRTIYNWRSLAKSLCEWSGLKFAMMANLPMNADKLLDCPIKDLSPVLQKVRAKMDEALGESHSAKQLFLHLGIKQSEIDSNGYPKAKLGRRKGEGGATVAQRQASAAADDEGRLIGLNESAGKVADFLMEHVGVKGVARIDEVPGGAQTLARFTEAVAYAHGFLQNLKKGRGQ